MEVRTNDGRGKLLFKWYPEAKVLEIVVKDMFYKIRLDENSYFIMEEYPKAELNRQIACA